MTTHEKETTATLHGIAEGALCSFDRLIEQRLANHAPERHA